MTRHEPVSLDELDALLDTPAAPWVVSMCRTADVADLDDIVVADLAAERDPQGTQATVAGAFAALNARHAGDRVKLALLAALQHQHLPDLLDEARGL